MAMFPVQFAVIWGGLRGLVAWRRAGEHFAVTVKAAALPLGRATRIVMPVWVALGAGARAGFGAAVLTFLYGELGVRFSLSDETLDKPGGLRGTIAMSCARTLVDLGGLLLFRFSCLYEVVSYVKTKR